MEQMTTHDLGNGWFANWTRSDATETMTIRNCDKGLRIDLPASSLATLRTIFASQPSQKEG